VTGGTVQGVEPFIVHTGTVNADIPPGKKAARTVNLFSVYDLHEKLIAKYGNMNSCFQLGVEIDPENLVIETDETNNCSYIEEDNLVSMISFCVYTEDFQACRERPGRLWR
jgi:hypothetical protein